MCQEHTGYHNEITDASSSAEKRKNKTGNIYISRATERINRIMFTAAVDESTINRLITDKGFL